MKRRRVGELMNPDVPALAPETTAGEAEQRLAERGLASAPVVDEQGHILGVVTLADLVRHHAETATAGEQGVFVSSVEDYRDLARTPVARSRTPVEKLMRREVQTVSRDTGVAIAANIMRERGVHRLLVTDHGVLVGMISSFDLLRVVEEAC